MTEFKVCAPFEPKGDQPKAIRQLIEGVKRNYPYQTLLGVTGSGKTFTMAKVIEGIQKPTLVIAPNKTLAAQLCSEFREFFPENAAEYFVSYYDYYQPEAYLPQMDLYIEKDASINDEIDRLRHAATSALLSRRDAIIVASVSCIYNLGSPRDYLARVVLLEKGKDYERDDILRKLATVKYQRNDVDFSRGRFRVRGDVVEIFPAYEDRALRIEMFGDTVERILEINPLTGEVIRGHEKIAIYPATHFVTIEDKRDRAIASIEKELQWRLRELETEGRLLEAQRLRARTRYDLEMIREVGYCAGIENYSRHFSGKASGEPPDTLLDYFPDDYLVFVDESHITVPQIHGMHGGDRSRKEALVDYGFRLPSAFDNRPLTFDEFIEKVPRIIFVSATPAEYELSVSSQVVEQIIRPTGLVDPEVIVRPSEGQIDDLMSEVKGRVARDERILVTTLTKRMAENLTDYLVENGIKARYMHADVATLERIKILTDLRLGEFDVLVGINLLREGLDLPEVSLVAILDADKEGFLRSERSLIQIIGRAARNVGGQVILYANEVTESMRRALSETNRRRRIQVEFNREHGIEPQTIRKAVTDIIQAAQAAESRALYKTRRRLTGEILQMPRDELRRLIQVLEEEMRTTAEELKFEEAARLRDEIVELRKELTSS